MVETRALLSCSLQVMAQFTVPVPDREVAEATDAVTIGEALQAAAQAAEMRATGLGGNVPGGLAAAVQRAAETNAKRAEGGGRVTLRDVVASDAAAAALLPANKVATREGAEKVAAAAARNVGEGTGKGGIVDAVAAAADVNEGRMV